MTAPTSLATERRSRRSFQAADVVRLAEISYRQLDYWTRTGLVNASGHEATGSGDARWYRDTDVLQVCVVAALVRAGVSLATVREHLEQVIDSGVIETPAVRITVNITGLRALVDNRRAS